MAEIISTSSGNEIITTRLVKAPQEKVFRAWADPEHLKNWWGPAGFTNTFNKFDFRVGGRWEFVMHGPEKGDYINACEFTRIDPPHLIAWKRHSKPLFQVQAVFEVVSETETKVEFKMTTPKKNA